MKRDGADVALKLEEKLLEQLVATFGPVVDADDTGIATAAMLTVVARVYARTGVPIELAMNMLKVMYEHHLKEPPPETV